MIGQRLFRPNQLVSRLTYFQIAAAEIVLFLVGWQLLPLIFPTPLAVLGAWARLWTTEFDNTSFGASMVTSLWTNFESVGILIVISLAIGYLTALPVFRPLAAGLSLGRFLAPAGLTLLFSFMTSGGHQLKVLILVFSGSVFLIPAIVDIVEQVPTERLEHARTLRMSEWRIVWEVIVLGTRDKVFDAIRGNAAMVWMMLTGVEVIVRYEGGVGVLLSNQERHLNLEYVFAIQLMFLVFGLLQDGLFVLLKRRFCPYAFINVGRT